MDETDDLGLSDESIQEPAYEPTFKAEDLIKIDYSYGYDCKRLYNMVLIDDNTIVFASGVFLHLFDIRKRTVTFRDSVFRCGIGFVTKNYNRNFQGLLTVGENGPNATVFIYEFPSFNVRVKLEGAAKQQFTCGLYNHSGELFASQAGYPDYMLTIWRWQSAEIILRSRAFQNDVLQIHFSQFNPILLVTCGLSHIKFWKMANTFTGLKLKGELGRFGKTDFSDIYAIYMLADENVISGCEWGNMLLWEAGLIKFEITRTERRPCHTKPIVRISMENGELTTFGMDGYIRIWLWETIDLADPPDDDRFVEVEPIYECFIHNCEIRAVQKIKLYDKDDYGYYLLDGFGGIWYCDLNTKDIPNDPYKLFNCHGGRILTAQVSPLTPHLITVGEDAKLSIYNYESKTLLSQIQFHSVCTSLIWFNTRISFSGRDLVAGFNDGFIRQFYFNSNVHDLKETVSLELLRAIKGHTDVITSMTINPRCNLLVTGSMDRTIFIYNISEKYEKLDFITLTPMGFIELNAIPNCFNWKDDKYTILIGCKEGEIFEYRLPNKISEDQTFQSYNITDKKELKMTKFVSIKSMIRRDLKRAATKKRKDKKKKKKLAKIEKLKKDNPGLQIDMESALADSEPEEEEEPLFIPPKPNPVLWLRYTNRNTIWVSMGGYDAGYIYELQAGVPKPMNTTLIADGDDCEIHSYLKIEEFLLFGLVNGKLRINRINPKDFTDLRNYRLINVHDPLNGIMPHILLSFNNQYLITIGHDGNIFTYKWSGPEMPLTGRATVVTLPSKIITKEDITDPNYLSLEQDKIYAEKKRQEDAAAAHAKKVSLEISILQDKFNKLLEENQRFDKDLRIPHKDMLLDQRIIQQIRDELQYQLNDVREDLAYDLEKAQLGKKKLYDYFFKNLDHIPIKINALRSESFVYSFRVECLGEGFEKLKDEIKEIIELEEKMRKSIPYVADEEKDESIVELPEETFFFGRDPNTIIPRFNKKMLRILNSYRARQNYEVDRIHSWSKMERQKPNPDKNHPDDDKKIEEAKKTLGDYKLKRDPNYEPTSNETMAYKYLQILNLREKAVNIAKEFNQKVFRVRHIKQKLFDSLVKYKERLDKLHCYIPEAQRKYIPSIQPINVNDEFPERNLIEECFPGCGIEIDDILYLQNTVDDLLPKPPSTSIKSDTMNPIDINDYEVSLDIKLDNLDLLPTYDIISKEIHNLPNNTDPAYWNNKTDETLPWLIENRYNWILNFMKEQDSIVNVVNHSVFLFDNQIMELSNERVQVKLEIDFINCLMTCLNQELYILRDSEQIENQLLSNADAALTTRNQAQIFINGLTRQIDELRKTSERLNDQIAHIQAKFITSTKGNKFIDFLRRIFRKKWRPPKPPKNDDDSSESSSDDESSSEEEDDAKSIDSTDMTAIRLDENTCPMGLDRAMYELTFKLRSDRHELERNLLDAAKQIDKKREEIAKAQKDVKLYTDKYNQEKGTLLEFRRKRQQELNKIYISVLLKMSQIQHIRLGEDFRDLSKSVLFDLTILNKLKSRVGTLQKEKEDIKKLHRINIVHLRRMNADIKFMRLEIADLEAKIKNEMMKKFGIVVKLDELEEEILRKYIFELETSAEQDINDLTKEINLKRKELALAEEELIRETRTNVDKINKLTVLTDERNFVERLIQEQQANYKKWLKPPNLSWDRDNEKLIAIDKEQKEMIQRLEQEIATLRIKAKPLRIDGEVTDNEDDIRKTEEVLPQDVPTCPDMFQTDAYEKRLTPDDFILERCQKVVQKLFMQRFGKTAGTNNVRRYAYKVSRYLAQAAYSFEGSFTTDILDCLIESIQILIPKKYMMLLSQDDINDIFNEILNIFDYERSEVKTDEVVAGIYDNAKMTLKKSSGILNTPHFMLVEMIKELIEILPLEELQSDNIVKAIVDNLMKESFFDGRCINIEDLIKQVVQYARDNLLDNVTSIPIRNLVKDVQEEYMKRRPNRNDIKQSF